MLWLALVGLAAGLPDLAFLPAAKCAAASDVRQCEVATPKEWTVEERRTIAQALQRLREDELARGIVAVAHANGYTGLSRYVTDTRKHPLNGDIAKYGPGFVLFAPKIIGITDAFFEMAEIRDARGGYRVGDMVLLHELVHAFDDRQQSATSEFTSLTGWTQIDGQWQYSRRVSISEYNGLFAETLTLYARGRAAEAWERDRAFATRLLSPVPTVQSLATPRETFADILAHLILDPTAPRYLPPDVVQWFEAHVFPGLRARAVP
jgi:hypothetical protein